MAHKVDKLICHQRDSESCLLSMWQTNEKESKHYFELLGK